MRMEEAVPLWGRRTQKKRSWKQGVCVEGSLAFPLAPAPDPAQRGEMRDGGWRRSGAGEVTPPEPLPGSRPPWLRSHPVRVWAPGW